MTSRRQANKHTKEARARGWISKNMKCKFDTHSLRSPSRYMLLKEDPSMSMIHSEQHNSSRGRRYLKTWTKERSLGRREYCISNPSSRLQLGKEQQRGRSDLA